MTAIPYVVPGREQEVEFETVGNKRVGKVYTSGHRQLLGYLENPPQGPQSLEALQEYLEQLAAAEDAVATSTGLTSFKMN